MPFRTKNAFQILLAILFSITVFSTWKAIHINIHRIILKTLILKLRHFIKIGRTLERKTILSMFSIFCEECYTPNLVYLIQRPLLHVQKTGFGNNFFEAQKPFAPETVLHQTAFYAFTPNNFYARRFLRQNPFKPETFCAKQLSHKALKRVFIANPRPNFFMRHSLDT